MAWGEPNPDDRDSQDWELMHVIRKQGQLLGLLGSGLQGIDDADPTSMLDIVEFPQIQQLFLNGTSIGKSTTLQ